MFRKNKEITCSCIIPELDLYLYCILNMSTDKKLKENNIHFSNTFEAIEKCIKEFKF